MQVYLIYYEIHREFKNMVDTSTGRSVMTMDVDIAYKLYERIAKN